MVIQGEAGEGKLYPIHGVSRAGSAGGDRAGAPCAAAAGRVRAGAARWWSFLGRLGAGTPESTETRAEWIDDAVDRFCRKNRLMKSYLEHGNDTLTE